MRLAIGITSSSRFDYLVRTTRELSENIDFKGEIDYFIHEDFVIREESEKIVHWAKHLVTMDGKKFFKKIGIDEEPQGVACGIDWIMDQLEDYDYMVYWQDDWVPLQKMPLNHCVKLMNFHQDIHQIAFPKRKIMVHKYGWYKKMRDFSGQILTTNPQWTFIPAIWRLSFVRSKWRKPKKGHNVWWANNVLKDTAGRETPDWIMANLGTYFYGAIKTGPMVEHIGLVSVRKGGLAKDED